MKIISIPLFVLLILFLAINPVSAADLPPADSNQSLSTPANVESDNFPWGLVVVFIVVGFIMTYLKKGNPNQITTTTCIPLIDEKKMEAEKQKIAEEESSQKSP
jgi:hypothetical protein